MLRLGIIGCGRVTSMFHLKAINQFGKITVTALSDISKERMNKVKNSCKSSNTYLNYYELLADANVDAVAVNTPPQTHETIVLDALRAGKHVLCEKPMTEKVEGCQKIKELQQQTGLTVLPAHNYTFTPSLVKMASQIERDSIGRITCIEVAFQNHLKSYRSQTAFRESKDNGIVQDVLPHILFAVYPLVGHVEDVSSVNWRCKNYNVCDNMDAVLISKTRVPISTTMSWTKLRPRFSVSVTGERGSMYTDLMMSPYKLEVTVDRETSTWKEKGIKWYIDLVQFKHPSFMKQYHHFYRLIKGKASPMITVDDEINMLEIIKQVSEKMDSE